MSLWLPSLVHDMIHTWYMHAASGMFSWHTFASRQLLPLQVETMDPMVRSHLLLCSSLWARAAGGSRPRGEAPCMIHDVRKKNAQNTAFFFKNVHYYVLGTIIQMFRVGNFQAIYLVLLYTSYIGATHLRTWYRYLANDAAVIVCMTHLPPDFIGFPSEVIFRSRVIGACPMSWCENIS